MSSTLNLSTLFHVAATGSNDPGVGSYTVQVRAANNSVLFSRAFTPGVIETEEGGTDVRVVSELIPVQVGASQIVILDNSATVIGTIPLGGSVPTVDISTAASGTLTGEVTFNWNVSDPDGGTHSAWVQYSPAGDSAGAWYNLITDLSGNSFTVDFDELPGSAGNGWLRVYVSDGAHTASDIVGPFSVPFKLPTVEIFNPNDGGLFTGNAVVLSGGGYDEDDGYLTEDHLQWSSSIGGSLGEGTSLGLADLAQGTHTITLTGTDSSGNPATDSVTIIVDRTQPELSLDLVQYEGSTQCVEITLNTSDALSGLDLVQMSYNGGVNWVDISTALFPYVFTVPGGGEIHLVARATDHAGNLSALDEFLYINTPCDSVTPAEVQGLVLLGGRITPPNAVNSQPFHVKVYPLNSSTPILDQYVTTDENGLFMLNVTPGTHRLWLKHDQGLAIEQTITLLSGPNEIDLGVMSMGDANNDNAVILIDFSILASTFGKVSGQAGYDARADFNGDNMITLVDFSLLAASYGKAGASP